MILVWFSFRSSVEELAGKMSELLQSPHKQRRAEVRIMADFTSAPKTNKDSESSPLRGLMDQFDDLPREVREALAVAISPSDQMIDVLCTMHRSGFPLPDLLKVISASNASNAR